MSFIPRRILGKILILGVALALAACSSNSSSPSTPSAPSLPYSASSPPNTYGLGASMTFANWPPPAGSASATDSFDIGQVDPSLPLYYISDRLNAGVSVINIQTLQYLYTAGGGKFTGFEAGGAAAVNGGPNGLVAVGGGIVFAGDGNSTLKVVDAVHNTFLASVPAVNPYTGAPLPATCGGAGTPTTGAGNNRLDEMDVDPNDHVVLAIDDAACPPFGTFFSTNAPYSAVGSVAFTTANGGAEQPRYDPTQHVFLEAIPSTIANPNGEVDVISPTTYQVTAIHALPAPCGPAGNVIGQNEYEFLACSNAGPMVINAVTGALITQLPSLYSGCDEAAYNPTANRFYCASSSSVPPVVVVANGTGGLITTITGGAGEHSVGVDPATDHVFVPTQKSGVQVWSH
jgi:hypothetical protein